VTAAALLAAFAAATAVAGVWELLAAVEQAAVVRAVGRTLAPLTAAGRRGREPTAPERRRLAVLGAAALLAAGWLVAGPLAGATAGAAGPWAVAAALRARRARWRAELGRGAPAAARAMADALAGGHAVRGAIATAARDGGVPGATGAELREAAAGLELGDRTEDVLERVRRRAADPRWDTIVAAILLQRESGGDLARLLRAIAIGQEEAARVEADARSATAQARFTAWLVTAMPAGAVVVAELASPGYVGSLLGSPATGALLVGAAVFQLLALVLVRRIARVEPR
jgi:tight adherence protein B